ncbi:hypothetical protein GIB67_040814 [Kingdonia uniflora]|uniref:RNase H type-1 domain-containing protein n=1 Tax=Kingdonia uniflora TaxID=39325 RepID=A0A7J7P4H3_9MAGN|nr:hypothetical protein GIB67_040814 [Kingdonia uniflora]
MGNPGVGGAGAVFRNHEGEVIGVLVHNLGIVTSFFAECFAIIDGLSKAKECGWYLTPMKIFLLSNPTRFHGGYNLSGIRS